MTVRPSRRSIASTGIVATGLLVLALAGACGSEDSAATTSTLASGAGRRATPEEHGGQGGATARAGGGRDGDDGAAAGSGSNADESPDHAPAFELDYSVGSWDTSDLDPLPGGVGGEDAAFSCIAYPTPSINVTQQQHGNDAAIDLGCDAGDALVNPFPVTARVVAPLITRFSTSGSYADADAYVDTCYGDTAPPDTAACNNIVTLQATIAGDTYQVRMLHIASADVQLGDTVEPFVQVATCGSVGWSSGPHAHLHVKKNPGNDQEYLYPGDLLSEDCGAVTSAASCDAGSTCCTAEGNLIASGQPGPGCNTAGQVCNGAGACVSTTVATCPAGNTAQSRYCGAAVGGDPSKLYRCDAGSFLEVETCSGGCTAAGGADTCAAPPPSGGLPGCPGECKVARQGSVDRAIEVTSSAYPAYRCVARDGATRLQGIDGDGCFTCTAGGQYQGWAPTPGECGGTSGPTPPQCAGGCKVARQGSVDRAVEHSTSAYPAYRCVAHGGGTRLNGIDGSGCYTCTAGGQYHGWASTPGQCGGTLGPVPPTCTGGCKLTAGNRAIEHDTLQNPAASCVTSGRYLNLEGTQYFQCDGGIYGGWSLD